MDIIFLRIRNKDLILFIALVVLGGVIQLNPHSMRWFDMFASGVMVFILFLIFYISGVMGAGDVKLATILGTFFGIHDALILWLASCAIAMLYTVYMQKAIFQINMSSSIFEKNKTSTPKYIPYGACMCIPAAVLLIYRSFVPFSYYL